MRDADEQREESVKIDIENVVSCLFKAYPSAKFICLNNGLTIQNEDYWRDHWYFIGFPHAPVYTIVDGYWAWVANEDIHSGDQEWGLFYLHISSKDHYYRGIPIQKDGFDFASSRYFCWELNDDGTLTQWITDEPEQPKDQTKRAVDQFDEFIKQVYLNPALSMLSDGRVSASAAGTIRKKKKKWKSS